MNDARGQVPAAHDSWYEIGTEVATLRIGTGVKTEVRFARVADITARAVVLDDGQRFDLPNLRRQTDGAWGPTVGMLPADSEKVKQALRDIEREADLARAKAVCAQFLADPNHTSATDAIMALAPLTGRGEAIWAFMQGDVRA